VTSAHRNRWELVCRFYPVRGEWFSRQVVCQRLVSVRALVIMKLTLRRPRPHSMISAAVPTDLIEHLDRLAVREDRSRSAEVRLALEAWVARCDSAAPSVPPRR